jgi:hypothetical protein
MTKRQEQPHLPAEGMAPVEIPAVRDALHQWLDAKEQQRRAGEEVRLARDVLMGHMAEAGVDRYGYNDPSSGKKKHVVADKTPRPKVIAAPIERAEKKGRRATAREKDVELPESRRVPRDSVKAEFGENFDDPFAKTRGLLGEANAWDKTEH